MSAIKVPENIKRMERQVKPWRVGVGVYKDNTPPEIIDMDKKVTEFYREAIGDFQ